MKSETATQRERVEPTRPIVCAVTEQAAKALPYHEIMEGLQLLLKRVQSSDIAGMDMWVVTLCGGKEVWGYLDAKAGEHGEDVLTLFLPSEYSPERGGRF